MASGSPPCKSLHDHALTVGSFSLLAWIAVSAFLCLAFIFILGRGLPLHT